MRRNRAGSLRPFPFDAAHPHKPAFMHKIFIACVSIIIGAGSAIASEETDVLAPVRQFIDGFNKGDIKMAEAACLDQIFIIDDFPPHAWSGSDAISNWLHDLDTFEKKSGTSDASVTLDKPQHVKVTGDRAYVVVPTKLSYKKRGQPINENGVMTLVLHTGADGWRIAAWAWADN